MSRGLILYAQVAVMLIALAFVTLAEEAPPGISDADAIRIYRSWLDSLTKEGLLPGLPTEDQAPKVRERQINPLCDFETVEVRGQLYMMLDARTGAVMKIGNQSACDRWHAAQDGKPVSKPRWTAEEALAAGERVLRLVWNRTTDDLILRSGYPSYLTADMAGHWRMEWDETLNGYRYHIQGYGVSLHEDAGLMSCGWGNVSDPCPTDVRVDRAQALRLARAFIDKPFGHLTWDAEHEGIAGLNSATLDSHPGLPNGSLLIVKPTPGWEQYGAKADKYATSKRATRLVYVVEFVPKEGRVLRGGSLHAERVIDVHVDAATGEIIGGLTYFEPR